MSGLGQFRRAAWWLFGVLLLRLALPLWHVSTVEHRAVMGQGGEVGCLGHGGWRGCPDGPQDEASHRIGGASSGDRAASQAIAAAEARPGSSDKAPVHPCYRAAGTVHGNHVCWLEVLERFSEARVEAGDPTLGRMSAVYVRALLDARERIWAETRHGLAPCLSPPV